ncbi:hypothetical protein [Stackebrandtia soli]|uniref:hypothetical protein n=1 Tax=Stackebrandtia soli TaxID=1892856 RepID=UPI0039EB4EBE
MSEQPRFRLVDEDLWQLEHFARMERSLRAWAPFWIAVDVGLVLFVLVMLLREADAATLWWSVPCLLCIAVIVGGIMWDDAFRGAGAADAVLAGGQPTLLVAATVVGDEGESPNPWTLEFDEAADGKTYAHLPEPVTDWALVPGHRYRVHLFGGDDRPFHGMVLFAPIEGTPGRRRWRHRVFADNSLWYTDPDG